jgi:hypothetical protein
MSHGKTPTIPFVLPLYHKMEKHLEAVANSRSSFTILNAVERGLEKLRKYSILAKKHHHNIIGTSRCFVALSLITL